MLKVLTTANEAGKELRLMTMSLLSLKTQGRGFTLAQPHPPAPLSYSYCERNENPPTESMSVYL